MYWCKQLHAASTTSPEINYTLSDCIFGSVTHSHISALKRLLNTQSEPSTPAAIWHTTGPCKGRWRELKGSLDYPPSVQDLFQSGCRNMSRQTLSIDFDMLPNIKSRTFSLLHSLSGSSLFKIMCFTLLDLFYALTSHFLSILYPYF